MPASEGCRHDPHASSLLLYRLHKVTDYETGIENINYCDFLLQSNICQNLRLSPLYIYGQFGVCIHDLIMT